MHPPWALLNAVFFLNGKNFCLQGAKEHKSLKLFQLKGSDEPPCCTYAENSSKNRKEHFRKGMYATRLCPFMQE